MIITKEEIEAGLEAENAKLSKIHERINIWLAQKQAFSEDRKTKEEIESDLDAIKLEPVIEEPIEEK